MGVSEILVQIDREIALMQQARAVLAGSGPASSGKRAVSATRKTAKKKRNLTPEGRKRIAEAVKRRWATKKEGGIGKIVPQSRTSVGVAPTLVLFSSGESSPGLRLFVRANLPVPVLRHECLDLRVSPTLPECPSEEGKSQSEGVRSPGAQGNSRREQLLLDPL